MHSTPSVNVEFLFVAESGALERQALLLAESIRKFGGRYAQARLTALQPRTERRISEETRREFAALDVKLVELAIVSPCPDYGPSFRIFACAEYERTATSDWLIFMDSDTVLLAEPDLELHEADVAVRPVDVKGMCTIGQGDINEPYWRELCRLCKVDLEQLPFVTSTVDRATVRASYNGGLTVVKTNAGLFAKTAGFFIESMNAKLVSWPKRTTSFPAGYGEVKPEGGRLWGSSQACLSLAITALKLRVRILPPSVNFPLNFHVELTPEILAGRLPAITHLHYHHFFRESPADNPLLGGMPGIPENAADWLRMHPRANLHAGKRLVLVLGMHRSGTSTVTKALETLGVELTGELMPADVANPKGYWEDMGFYQLNEELLGALNQSWASIGFMDTAAIARLCDGPWFRRALDLLHVRFTERSLIGLKDPRFCLLLPFWEKAFHAAGITVSRVIAVRNPRSVAASLKHRDALPEAHGLWLWWLYNAPLFATVSEAPAAVVDYDALMDAPREQLSRMARALDLTIREEHLATFANEFLDPSLRHTCYKSTSSNAPSDEIHPAFATYTALQTLSHSEPPSLETWRALPDQWRQVVGASQSLLEMSGGLFAETHRLQKENESQSTTIIMLEAQLASLTGKPFAREGVTQEKNTALTLLAERNVQLEARIKRIQNSLAWQLYTPLLFIGKRFSALRKRAAKRPAAPQR